jgi:hypothetical protein
MYWHLYRAESKDERGRVEICTKTVLLRNTAHKPYAFGVKGEDPAGYGEGEPEGLQGAATLQEGRAKEALA